MPIRPASALPPASPDALQHSAQLTALIQQQIVAHGGWLSFEKFMELALYAPGLGYYTAGAHKFGEPGDFITAPELSVLFGRCLARQAAEIMALSSPYLLELGAGSGKLAVDVLRELEQLGQLPDQYAILEVSADLRARQQTFIRQQIPHLAHRVHWLDELPARFSGALIANEVLDALPVHLVHWRDSALMERGVTHTAQGFFWQEREIQAGALRLAAEKIPAPDDYLSEICLSAPSLITSLAGRLQQGALLFIDYGFGTREYYHPQRDTGTLMCHYRHHAHADPFYLPGLQDITAHVNFTDIAEAGIDAGLDLLGYTNQAFFLINSGITEFLAEISPEDIQAYQPLSAQLQKLTSPAEMGELFKVIALGKKIANPLRGFASGELTRTL